MFLQIFANQTFLIKRWTPNIYKPNILSSAIHFTILQRLVRGCVFYSFFGGRQKKSQKIFFEKKIIFRKHFNMLDFGFRIVFDHGLHGETRIYLRGFVFSALRAIQSFTEWFFISALRAIETSTGCFFTTFGVLYVFGCSVLHGHIRPICRGEERFSEPFDSRRRRTQATCLWYYTPVGG